MPIPNLGGLPCVHSWVFLEVMMLRLVHVPMKQTVAAGPSCWVASSYNIVSDFIVLSFPLYIYWHPLHPYIPRLSLCRLPLLT